MPKLYRSVSANSLNHGVGRNKNIPMVHEQRPPVKQWNGLPLAEAGNEDNSALTPHKSNATLPRHKSTISLPEEDPNKASISPLTVPKDNYDVKRPIAAAPTTDNSFQNLDPTVSKRNSTQIPSLASSSTAASTTNKIYNKMSHLINLAHNSMHSLVPMTGKLPHDSMSGSTTKDSRPRYRSELDDDEDDELHTRKYDDDNETDYDLTETQYNMEQWDTSTLYTTHSPKHLEAKGKRLQEILQEINDFQNDFVQKMNTVGTQGTKNTGVNRTQQRVLDYRDLYEADGDFKADTPSSLMVFRNKTNTSPFGDSFNYSIKIQHDTILSDYTLIRLRFGSTLSSNDSKGMRSHTGVLGFINRVTELNSDYKRSKAKKLEENVPWHCSCSSEVPSASAINFDNKEAYLRDLWSRELTKFLPENPELDAEPEVSSEDAGIYESSISNMARNVRLRN